MSYCSIADEKRSSSKALNVLDVKFYFYSSASRAIKFIDEETFVMDFNLNTRKLFVNVLNCFLRQNFCVSNFFHFVQKRYWWIFHWKGFYIIYNRNRKNLLMDYIIQQNLLSNNGSFPLQLMNYIHGIFWLHKNSVNILRILS